MLDEPIGGPPSRRDALKQLGIGAAGAAAVWTAPSILRLDAASASGAQPIQFVASNTNSTTQGIFANGGTQDLAVTRPAGVQENDLLLAIVGTNGSSSVSVIGSTWSLQGQNTNTVLLTTNRAVVLSRSVGPIGSEPSSYTFRRTYTAAGASASVFRVLVVAYRYVTAINTGGVTSSSNASAALHTFPTAAGRQSGWAIRLGLGGPGGAATWATATSPAVQDANTGNSDRNLVVFHQQLAAGFGTVATGTTNLGISPNRPAVPFTVALNSQLNP